LKQRFSALFLCKRTSQTVTT